MQTEGGGFTIKKNYGDRLEKLRNEQGEGAKKTKAVVFWEARKRVLRDSES